MQRIKLKFYSSVGVWKKTLTLEDDIIRNADSLIFSENLDGGQGKMTIELGIRYNSTDFMEGDFVEYSIFSENYKNGLHKFTGYIPEGGIKRRISKTDGDSVSLEVEGLSSLLSDFSISKTYSGTLTSVINTFIIDFHAQKNISSPMEYLGTQILKNGVSSTTSINVAVNGKFFDALKSIFGTNRFFIDKTGTIRNVSEVTRNHTFAVLKEAVGIEIGSEILIELSTDNFDIQAGDKFRLENIDSSLELSNTLIEKVDFSLSSQKITAGKILFIGDVIN